MTRVRARPRFHMRPSRCPYCHDPVRGRAVTCSGCTAPHHADCWTLHGGCSACGLGGATPAGVRSAPLDWRQVVFAGGALVASLALVAMLGALLVAWASAPLAVDARVALAGVLTFVGVTTSVGHSVHQVLRGEHEV